MNRLPFHILKSVFVFLVGVLLLTACRDIISIGRNQGGQENPAPTVQVEEADVDTPPVDSGETPPTVSGDVVVTPSGQTPNQSSTPIPDLDLRSINFGAAPSGATINLTVENGDASLLFFVRAEDTDQYVVIDKITDPDGQILYELNSTTGVATGEIFKQRLENNGSIALYLPPAPQFDLKPGNYAFTFRAGDGDPAKEVGAIIRAGDVEGPQILDVNFWVVSAYRPFLTPDSQATIVSQLQTELSATLEPHNLTLGQVNFLEATEDAKDQVANLQSLPLAAQLSELCLMMAAEVGSFRALNVVVLDELIAPEGVSGVGAPLVVGEAVPLPEDSPPIQTDIKGVASGHPGLVMTPNSAQSCVAIIMNGDYDFAQNRQGQNLLHQASRFMGVPFTTSPEGVAFDLFADTPECARQQFDANDDEIVDAAECAAADAGNYMFWSEGGSNMTPNQAWTIRRHPLFRPANE